MQTMVLSIKQSSPCTIWTIGFFTVMFLGNYSIRLMRCANVLSTQSPEQWVTPKCRTAIKLKTAYVLLYSTPHRYTAYDFNRVEQMQKGSIEIRPLHRHRKHCVLNLCSIAKEVLIMLNSCRNINWEESLTIRYRYEWKRLFTATNHRQLNEKAVRWCSPCTQWDYNYPLLESNSEQKTNLGNTN